MKSQTKKGILIGGASLILIFLIINQQNTSGEPRSATELKYLAEKEGSICSISTWNGLPNEVICENDLTARVFPNTHKYPNGIADLKERVTCREFLADIKDTSDFLLDSSKIGFTIQKGRTVVIEGLLSKKALCNKADNLYISMNQIYYDRYMELIPDVK